MCFVYAQWLLPGAVTVPRFDFSRECGNSTTLSSNRHFDRLLDLLTLLVLEKHSCYITSNV